MMAYAESHHELKNILTLEYDKTIKYYLTQPATFTIEVDGKMIPHTPDVVVIYHDETVEFIQIKLEEKAQDKEYLRRFNQIAKFCKKELGVNYTLKTEASFKEGKYIENLQQLYAYLDIKLNPQTTEYIMEGVPSTLIISDLEQCMAKYGKIDLIILDLMLPFNTGFEICEEIRTLSVFDSVPIVAYSARHGEDVIEELKEAGFKGLIAKPFYGNFIYKLKKIFREDSFTYLRPSSFLN